MATKTLAPRPRFSFQSSIPRSPSRFSSTSNFLRTGISFRQRRTRRFHRRRRRILLQRQLRQKTNNLNRLEAQRNELNSRGPHFNPPNKIHSAPEDANRHAGDLGNIIVGDDGTTTFTITDNQIPLTGPNSIVGRVVIVHADPDDLGKGGHELSVSTGNAGGCIACGFILVSSNHHAF